MTSEIYEKLRELEAIENAVDRRWGVMLVLEPTEAPAVIDRLLLAETWEGFGDVETRRREKCPDAYVLRVDGCVFEFTTNGADRGDFYYVTKADGPISGRKDGVAYDTLWMTTSYKDTDSLIAAQRVAEEIKEFEFPGVRFIMVAMDAC